jgi:transposase-like protein
MTKAEQARITAWRLKILRSSQEEPRQVARTCRYFDISRTLFYRWKRRFDELGEAGLADRPRHAPSIAAGYPARCGEQDPVSAPAVSLWARSDLRESWSFRAV